ncbi:probable Alp11 homologue of tubulin-folding cofactor B [Cephalotrichum gorgonifer]|uniref:Probable Alp11 homologue of tubulin-folding cofactor B n=1 Tax=Cephalotrichum gorgonifer TaxID=2041049 RepID=A0AAE8N1M8_9PEZI|nr:probable Alp11 homologue of tubulin-folding cofactor B [Cephalotrichum gorgonifer]
MADIVLYVTSDYSSSERRVTPSWSVDQFKSKMETVTGIPPSSQRLEYRAGGQRISMEVADEEGTPLSAFPLAKGGEIYITDIRPPSARPNLNDTSAVDKYVMPEEEYAQKTDSVLAWKKAQKLGRFDPNAPSIEAARIAAIEQEVRARGIEVGKRCRVGGEDTRRGEVMYVGEVAEIPGGIGGSWIGVRLDEPAGKNDGSIGGKRYWGEETGVKHGVFVRPDRVEVGDFPVWDDLEDMEEI